MAAHTQGEEPEVDSDEHKPDEMSFLDHLEELRWRVVKAVIGVVVGSLLCWVYIEEIVHYVLLRPVQAVNSSLEPGQQAIHLQNLKPFGLLFMYMEIALVGGIILSLPNLMYQLWAFIAPGLLPKERRYIKSIVFFTTFCFLSGISFAYFIMLPSALNFLAGLSTEEIANNIAINEYMSFVVSVILAAGVIFELPMVSWFLSKLGILTPAFMRHYRKHAIVGILIVSAVLTPGTDPVSQILLAIPMIVLYEISIWISAAAQKKREQTA